jgi:hypothetical protein
VVFKGSGGGLCNSVNYLVVVMRGLSDSNLQSMWRKAIIKLFGGRCFFCGSPTSIKEAHHAAQKRNMLLLKHDYRCGILCCKFQHDGNKQFKMSCHRYAETPIGKKLIQDYQEKNGWLEYLHERSRNSKQWLVEHGMTRNEFLLTMYKELKEIINGR